MAVLLVAIIAILLSLRTNENFLSLVAHAWVGFIVTFGPFVVLFSLYWKRTSGLGILFGMVTGVLTVLFWLNIPSF
ncbi:sodium:solute symporter family transporter [Bacteroidetes bacterium endosymbiont of Geopemphigus sp.]|uniref:sodium:solute symporter family transporter n=1 Tax=Bacteroidetes bacterium endosymbiont of Geopemphigus sp. TaxID=2047937 RepID=UPI000CD0761B